MRYPDFSEVMALGVELGFDFTEVEARVVHDRLLSQLAGLETFAAKRLEQQTPNPILGARHEWWFANESEDPLNAFVTRCEVTATHDGPLRGKRVALKDNIGFAGLPLTFGTEFMQGYLADFDATVAARLLKAGATITGKVNMYEFSLGDVPGTYGRVLNPHDLNCETGGSSSGSAAAVGGQACDIAMGGDQGGSIRIPSAWCGTVGLKPSYGLVPHTGIFGTDPALDYVGPMARSVEEVATVLDCISGPDGYDPRQYGLREFQPVTPSLKDGVEGLRIGLLRESFASANDDVAKQVRAAAALLADAGAIVEEFSMPGHLDALMVWPPLFLEGTRYLVETNLGGAFSRTWYPESLIAAFGKFRAGSGHLLPMNYRTFMTVAEYVHRRYHGQLYAKAHNVRQHITALYDSALRTYDVLMTPTVPEVAQRFGEPTSYEEAVDMRVFGGAGLDLGRMAENVMQFNYTGHPALTVPCGKIDGLPVGLQLIGQHLDDATLLRVGYAYQDLVEDWDELVACPRDLAAAYQRAASPAR